MSETTVRFFIVAAGLVIVALFLGVDLAEVGKALLWIQAFLSGS